MAAVAPPVLPASELLLKSFLRVADDLVNRSTPQVCERVCVCGAGPGFMW